MTSHFAWLLVLAAAAVPTSDAPVPVEQEPHHKTVFQNSYIQAFHVTVPPGQSTLMHVHSRDDGAVRLSDATVTNELPGKPPGAPESVHPGDVSARDSEAHPLTHRVNNVGTTVFEVMDVQALGRPPGPATEALATPAAENAKMRLYRWELAPGATSPMHEHRRPYLVVSATDVNLRMAAPDGQAMVHPVKAGDLHWVDTPVTHTLGNSGAEKAVLVEIELK